MKFQDLQFERHEDRVPGHLKAECQLSEGLSVIITRAGDDAEFPDYPYAIHVIKGGSISGRIGNLTQDGVEFWLGRLSPKVAVATFETGGSLPFP